MEQTLCQAPSHFLAPQHFTLQPLIPEQQIITHIKPGFCSGNPYNVFIDASSVLRVYRQIAFPLEKNVALLPTFYTWAFRRALEGQRSTGIRAMDWTDPNVLPIFRVGHGRAWEVFRSSNPYNCHFQPPSSHGPGHFPGNSKNLRSNQDSCASRVQGWTLVCCAYLEKSLQQITYQIFTLTWLNSESILDKFHLPGLSLVNSLNSEW